MADMMMCLVSNGFLIERERGERREREEREKRAGERREKREERERRDPTRSSLCHRDYCTYRNFLIYPPP